MKTLKNILSIVICFTIFFSSSYNLSFAKSKKTPTKKNPIKYLTTENELVNVLTKEILAQKEKIVIPLDYKKLDMNKISNAMRIVQSKPEVMSIKKDWDPLYAYIINGKYNLTLNVKYYKDASNLSTIINKLIKENLSENMTNEEKVRAIHDFIILKTAYSKGASKSEVNGYSVYAPLSILYEGKGVCQSYALTFFQMAKNAGLNVIYVSGYTFKSDIGHAWNMVELDDGKFYHLDVTWDDPTPDTKGKVRYKYYLRGDDFMSKTHKWDKSKFPKADEDYWDEEIEPYIDNSYEESNTAQTADNNYVYSNQSEETKSNDSYLQSKSDNINGYGAITDASPTKITNLTTKCNSNYCQTTKSH